MRKPKNWPNELAVFDNGGAWSGLAVDPNDRPVSQIRDFFDSIGERDTTPRELWDGPDWTFLEWNKKRGCYCGAVYGTADGKHTQTPAAWSIEDLHYQPNTD